MTQAHDQHLPAGIVDGKTHSVSYRMVLGLEGVAREIAGTLDMGKPDVLYIAQTGIATLNPAIARADGKAATVPVFTVFIGRKRVTDQGATKPIDTRPVTPGSDTT